MRSPDTTIIRAARATYVVAGVLAAVLLLLAVMAVAARPSDRSSWEAASFIAALVALVLAWIRAFRIEFHDGVMRYRSLFGGSRPIRLTDIQSAEVEVGVKRARISFRPTFRLVVRTRPGTGERRELVINLKVFSLPDVEALMRLCGANTNRADSGTGSRERDLGGPCCRGCSSWERLVCSTARTCREAVSGTPADTPPQDR